MSVIITKKKQRLQPKQPEPEPRFQSDQAYDEFKVKSATEKLGYKPKPSIPLTPEENRLIDARWSKMKKSDLTDPRKNADLMPEKEIIDEEN